MPKDYAEATEGLVQGPRYKSDATKDLEEITRALLTDLPRNAVQRSKWSFNSLGELEVKIDDCTYNLTQILLHNPDFEQIELIDDEIILYPEIFNKFSHFIPKLDKTATGLPNISDYAARDPKELQGHLLYAEKLALTLYTNTTKKNEDEADFFRTLNEFLRVHGQMSEFATFTPYMLGQMATQLLLTAVVASQALEKVPAVVSDEDQDVMTSLYRAEDPSSFDQVRRDDVQANRITLQKGLTSTSQKEELINTAKQTAKTNNVAVTITHYQQPKSVNPIGKKIKQLSMHEDEGEITFPASTQIKYVAAEQVDQILSFAGIPVRTIEGIDPFSYSRRESGLRSELLEVNLAFVNETIKDLKEADLFNFKNMVAQETNAKSEMMSSAFTAIDQSIMLMRLVEAKKDQIQDAEYVYEHHLKYRFTETHLCNTDAYLDVDGGRIERPNHGLAHTQRVTAFLQPVIDYLAEFAKDPKFRDFCKTLSSKLMEQLELASLFYVTGRESEASITSDKGTYHRYKIAAYKNFKDRAKKKGMNKEEIQKFKNILLGAQQLYDNFGKASNEEQFLFNIITVAHRIDLFRCYDATKIKGEIEQTTNRLMTKSPDQQKSLESLLQMAQDTIFGTGDRFMSKFEGGSFVDVNNDYNEDLFYICSTNPTSGFKQCIYSIIQTHPLKVPPLHLQAMSKEDLDKLFIYAIKQGHLETVKLLLKHGVDPQKNHHGKLPLFLAAKKNHPNIIKVLIDAGVDPHQTNQEGETALHIAVDLRNVAAIKALIAAGADPTQKNKKGVCGGR